MHLIIDAVNDRFDHGYLDISVRYLTENALPATRFYGLIKLEDDTTGKHLCKILEATVLFSSKRKEHLISLISNGAGSMCEKT